MSGMATKAPKKAKAKLSTREKLALLKEAYRLIKKPESYVSGKWRCPIYERNDETGEYEHAVDGKGRRLWRYCIEGALNQASVNVFGVDRAIALGAVSKHATLEILNDESGTCYLEQQILGKLTSLDSLADELYTSAWRKAMGYAEGDESYGRVNAMSLNDESMFGHKAVVKILKLKIAAVQAQVDQLDARKARA